MAVLENVIAALIVSLIVLLSWMARRHSTVYARIAKMLSTYAFSATLAALTYDFGIYRAIATTNSKTETIDGLLIPIWLITALYFAFTIYLLVLDNINKIFGDENNDGPK